MKLAKKIIVGVMGMLMVVGVYISIANFKAKEAKAYAVWKDSYTVYFMGSPIVKCFGIGQTCCEVYPDQQQ